MGLFEKINAVLVTDQQAARQRPGLLHEAKSSKPTSNWTIALHNNL
jgi:hypothetical protein